MYHYKTRSCIALINILGAKVPPFFNVGNMSSYSFTVLHSHETAYYTQEMNGPRLRRGAGPFNHLAMGT